MTTGARNLLILGVASIVISVATSVISLAIYHDTGDIYLDRSRPGFLPDEDEIKQNDEMVNEEYSFGTSGKITKEELDEYLEKLNLEIKMIDGYEDPFDAEALSDERFGL